jgi:outer membrane protein TolC
MAIMTQIYVARSRFLYLADELGTARRAQTVQQRLLAQAQSAFKARAISQQQLVREELNFVLSEIRYDVAYSDVQNAYANLYASMGLDNFDIGASQDIPINQLASALEEYWTERSLTLPSKPEPTT